MEAVATNEDTALIEKREEIKRQLATGEYKSLARVVADWTGRFIQKFTRTAKPLPFWFSITVVVLVVLLLGLLTTFLGGFSLQPQWLLFGISAIGIILVTMLIAEAYLGIISTVFHNHLLNALESITDLADFQERWAVIFSVKNQLIFALGYTILTASFIVIFNPVLVRSVGLGLSVSIRIFDILIGAYFYIAFQTLRWFGRLSRYQFKLYAADPGNSEVIDQLANMLSYGVYIVAGLAALFTLFLASFQALTLANIIFAVLVLWVPTTAFFTINQYVLSSIITRAKWKTLNGIQAQIETLQAQENILSEDTLGHIDKLMDYHDRIRATRNSALDLRAGLNFLNSLLLPVIAFVLANLQDIIELFFN